MPTGDQRKCAGAKFIVARGFGIAVNRSRDKIEFVVHPAAPFHIVCDMCDLFRVGLVIFVSVCRRTGIERNVVHNDILLQLAVICGHAVELHHLFDQLLIEHGAGVGFLGQAVPCHFQFVVIGVFRVERQNLTDEACPQSVLHLFGDGTDAVPHSHTDGKAE